MSNLAPQIRPQPSIVHVTQLPSDATKSRCPRALRQTSALWPRTGVSGEWRARYNGIL